MKKFMRTALVLVLAMVCLATTALAADPTVTYSGNSGNFVFAPDDLFADFKGVMPGDSLTEEIVIKNKANKKVDVNIYLRALGATEGEDFLNQLDLKVVNKSNGKTLFDGKAGETGQLSVWKAIGTFKSGSEAKLEVTLTVPITMGNEFNLDDNAQGKLQWEFRVEEYPVQGPQTGDETPLALYGAVAAVCALGLLALLLTKKKRNQA